MRSTSWGDPIDAIALIVLRERASNLAQVADGDQRGVGVCAVDDHLQGRGPALAQIFREAGVNLQGDRCLAQVNEFGDLALLGELSLDVEVRAGRKAGDQVTAFLAVVLIENNRGHVANFEGGRVTEDEHLDDGRTKQYKARPLVAENLDEFLD
jgi:hypothetical protein